MEKSKLYFYQKKYRTNSEKFSIQTKSLKKKIFNFLSKTPFLERKLKSTDRYHNFKYNKETYIAENYYVDNILNKNKLSNFSDFNLNFISFFEAIEIDKFDSFKKRLIKKFAHKHSFFKQDIRFRNELAENLSKVKINLDTLSVGKLIELDFKKHVYPESNLIDYISISYIKTYESYFILHIEVKTSSVLNEFVNKIFSGREIGLQIPHLHSFKNIIKYGVFWGHTSFKSSITRLNIDNLISDLQYQVFFNILRPLRGYLYSSEIRNFPFIEHYTTKNFKSKKKLNKLRSFFDFSDIVQFSSDDELVDIYINQEKHSISLIKEEGHGTREIINNDHSDYDWLESYYLINGLAFPCIFAKILQIEHKKLNYIKRNIYDFLERSDNWGIKKLLIIPENFHFIKLKKDIAKLNLLTNRFKNEFNANSFSYLINHSEDLSIYKFSDNNFKKKDTDNENLLEYFINCFSYGIDRLSKRKDNVNEIFKNIEELNNFRTNFILQVASLIIALLALIFAFDKVKNLL